MTTSGNTTNTLACLEIITDALAILRVGVGGEPLADEDAQDARRSLNLMVKAWQADGLHLWIKSEGVLFLANGQSSYGLGAGSTDHAALASGVVQTALAADALSGAMAVTVGSASGIANSATIGIELSDGTLHWTTVSHTPSGVTVRLADAIPTAASEDGVVYAYATPILRPARILSARRRDATSVIDVPVTILERPDYFDQPNKTNAATPTMVYYDPQLVMGRMYVWSAPQIETDTIRFTFERPLEVFSALTDTADLPDEWLETLTYNLAYRLAPKHRFPMDERALLRTDALVMKDKLMGFDREYGSVFVQPDFTQGGGYGP